MDSTKKVLLVVTVALVVSVATNIYGAIQHRKISNEASDAQAQLVTLQKKIAELELRSSSTSGPNARPSREEYIERRNAQMRKQNALARMSTQKRESLSRSEQLSREAVQRRQQGSAQTIQ